MSDTNNQLLGSLLNSEGNSASDMTHNLSLFGQGDMSTGIENVYEAGKQVGVERGSVVTAIIFAVVFGGYLLVKNAVKDRHIKKALSEATVPDSVSRAGDSSIDDNPQMVPTELSPQPKTATSGA